ncbi:DnaJ domain-containing protein [Halorubrum sp. JWXQ-INN 858]|uniref:J domain-containing protein n=1 Tax=Halorubrum sp. JWXQ-INN 858 TaxID=2690782 RepID=UPI0013F81FE2|nr:J domain-containing protein [Halorubrum sp. JWXQ-INN 858]MWV65166.1 DnaJ domain-containing protein [Halorubrum sp. JWXQ-INN 858]
MTADVISIVPPWMLVGTALGGAASVVVALVFYLGTRLSPPTASAASGRSTDGDARRRREIREYLSAIGERFREGHSLGGVVVPFYLPERGVAITFDAHDYFELKGEGVFTVLCEHEMPGRGLGRRLPFEVTEPEWGPRQPSAARSTRDPVADAFEELGLSTDAEAATVKRAYRERVKEVHPDQGGDERAFRRVREAYATASNHADGTAERADPVPGFGR